MIVLPDVEWDLSSKGPEVVYYFYLKRGNNNILYTYIYIYIYRVL